MFFFLVSSPGPHAIVCCHVSSIRLIPNVVATPHPTSEVKDEKRQVPIQGEDYFTLNEMSKYPTSRYLLLSLYLGFVF